MNRVKAIFRGVGRFISRFAPLILTLAFVASATTGTYLLTVVERKRSEWKGLWRTSWTPDPSLGRYETWAMVLFCIAAGFFLATCLVVGWKLWMVSGRELEKRRTVHAAPGPQAPQGVPGPAAQGGTP